MPSRPSVVRALFPASERWKYAAPFSGYLTVRRAECTSLRLDTPSYAWLSRAIRHAALRASMGRIRRAEQLRRSISCLGKILTHCQGRVEIRHIFETSFKKILVARNQFRTNYKATFLRDSSNYSALSSLFANRWADQWSVVSGQWSAVSGDCG